MRSGKSVYRDLQRRVTAANESLARVGRGLQALRDQDEGLRGEQARTLARLAKVRLGELAGSRVAEGLDAADHGALALLADRERERERLRLAIAEGAAGLAELMAEREQRLHARDVAAQAFHDQVEATRQRLDGVETYRAQVSHAQFTAGQAANADQKANRAEQDRETKGKPYESNKLFGYLWRRRYRFPEYRAWPLVAALDGWVARLCGYDQAHRDYGMLLEIPVRLRAHRDGLAAVAEREAQARAEMESQALAEDGGTPLREAWHEAQQGLDDVEARLHAAEAAQDRICLEQNSLDAGNDPYSARAAQLIEAQLSTEDVATLRRDAAETATAADDELVREIAALRSQSEQLQPQIADLRGEHGKCQSALNDVETIARKFRRQDFGAENSMFDSDFDIGLVLGDLLGGVLRRSAAWSRVRRQQSWRSSGWGSSSSGSFGGFGGGGGFGGFGGGGGFSSGGGFGGGGGGFSTGGGF